MPALAETQVPLFRIHKECGLLPERFPNETVEAYYSRLARTYYIPVDYIIQEFTCTS